MPKGIHYHLTIDHILPTTVGVVIVINLWRIGAAKLAQAPGVFGKVGHVAGSLVTWGGTR